METSIHLILQKHRKVKQPVQGFTTDISWATWIWNQAVRPESHLSRASPLQQGSGLPLTFDGCHGSWEGVGMKGTELGAESFRSFDTQGPPSCSMWGPFASDISAWTPLARHIHPEGLCHPISHAGEKSEGFFFFFHQESESSIFKRCFSLNK